MALAEAGAPAFDAVGRPPHTRHRLLAPRSLAVALLDLPSPAPAPATVPPTVPAAATAPTAAATRKKHKHEPAYASSMASFGNLKNSRELTSTLPQGEKQSC